MDVSIRFAWGDGDTSDWSAFVAPGESVSMDHKWTVPDTYTVTAQARDTGNARSPWSAPHHIRIRMPDTLLLWRVKLNAIEGRSFYSSPAFGQDGNIYVGSPDGALYSLDTAGTLRWRYLTGNVIAGARCGQAFREINHRGSELQQPVFKVKLAISPRPLIKLPGHCLQFFGR